MSRQKKISQHDYEKEGRKFGLYIRESDFRLRSDEYLVVHLDGVNFTSKKCKHLTGDLKKFVFECLVKAAIELCNRIESARVAYVAGDEISILLDGTCVKENHHNRIQKLVSIFASIVSLSFNSELKKYKGEDKGNLDELIKESIFAAKGYNIPSEMVNDYFKWRLLACKKLIFDKREDFESKEDWEKFGAIITYKSAKWGWAAVDFENKKLCKQPQDEYYKLQEVKL